MRNRAPPAGLLPFVDWPEHHLPPANFSLFPSRVNAPIQRTYVGDNTVRCNIRMVALLIAAINGFTMLTFIGKKHTRRYARKHSLDQWETCFQTSAVYLPRSPKCLPCFPATVKVLTSKFTFIIPVITLYQHRTSLGYPGSVRWQRF